MSFDLLIRNGTVIDGTGSPGFRVDVGVRNGKIVALGQLGNDAIKVIDATGRMVCPGFIDPHTHYDAQVCWDPVLSPSSWHGVTTAVMGNCGVGLAPCPPHQREMTMWDLTNVESIPIEVLQRAIPWDWETFPEYMDAARRRGMGVNVGFLAPLTPFRHTVMGEASMDRAANAEETAQIAQLLKEAVAAGAMGFSTSAVRSHVGYKGRPLACRNTSQEEFRAYCHVLRDLGKGVIAIALLKVPGMIAQDEYDMLDLLLTESGRKVTWMSVFARDDYPDAHSETLRIAEPLIKRGALPQATPKPLVSDIDMTNPFLFSHFDCVHPVFNQPPEVQMRVYADPEFRKAFKAALAKPSVARNDWRYYEVQEAENPALKHLEGMTIAAIAKERDADPVDVLFDLSIQDNLKLRFTVTLLNGNDDRVAEIVDDPRVLIGLGDGGAHVDAMCDAAYPSVMLGKWVREKKVLTFERAVQRMTSEPADFFGIRNRGRIAVGLMADLVVFDPATVGCPPRPTPRRDLPGGARRLVVEPTGIDCTIVNGAVLFDHGRDTGARVGQVLRSGEE
jgi:N-acyl-D-aspartate/D-glutamate deacylase